MPGLVVDPNRVNPEANQPQAAAGADREFLAALDGAASEIGAEQQQGVDSGAITTQQQQLDQKYKDAGLPSGIPNPLEALGLGGAVEALGTGAWKALFETKDAVVGEPNFQDKSQFRQSVERDATILDRQSAVNSIVGDITQFGVGLLGAGKFTAPAKIGKAAKWGFEAGKAAAIGATVFDPHEERLSNLVQQYPDLANPVTKYLAADPTDTAAEGRLKSAIESIGLDAALAGIFAVSLKAMRYAKAGKTKEAEAASRSLEQLIADHEAAKAKGTAQPATDMQQGDLRSQFAQGPQNAVEVPPGAGSNAGTEVAPQVPMAAGESPKAPAQAANTVDEVMARNLAKNDAPKGVGADVPQSTIERVDPKNPTAGLTVEEPAFKEPKDIPAAQLKQLIDETDTITASTARQNDLTGGAAITGRAPGGIINWSRTPSSTEVGVYVQRTANILEGRFNLAKGGSILKDKNVNLRVQRMVNAFGEDPAYVLGNISAGGKAAAKSTAVADAAFTIGQSIVSDALELSKKIKYGLVADVAAAEAQRAHILSLGFETLAQAQSIVSNAGRTLRRQRRQFAITPQAIEAVKGMDPKALTEALYHSGGDIKKVVKMATEGWTAKFARGSKDMATALLINGNLSWWPTHVVNLTSSALMLGLRPIEKLIGSTFIPGQISRELRNQALKEFRYSMSSISDGLSAALDAYIAGDSIMHPHDSFFAADAASGAALAFKPMNSLDGIIHNALVFGNPKNLIGQPTRLLGAADEMVKTIRYRAVVLSRASREAEEQGLKGKAAKDYLEQRMEEAFGPAGEAIDDAALREAQVTTFSQQLGEGTLGKTIQNAVAAHPLLLRPVFTYVRTPINAFRYAIKMTPGLNIFQKEMRDHMRGLMGPEAQAHAFGQVSMGVLLTGYALSLAQSGVLTGAGPQDPKMRQQLTSTGWRPYSYIYTDDKGEKRYLPLGRLEPLGTIFGIAADLTDIQQHPEKRSTSQSLSGAMLVAVVNNVMNKTFLMSVQQAIRAVADPENSLGKKIGDTAESMVPYSGLLRGTNPDQYLREARGLVDNALDTMPGYSPTLPPKRDIFGDPILAQRGLWADDNADQVAGEINRIILDTGEGFSPPSFSKGDGVDLRDLVLEDGRTAYDKLQEYSGVAGSQNIKTVLAKVMDSKLYEAAPDGPSSVKGTKSSLLAPVFSKFREAAYKKLLMESPLLRDAVNKRKIETAAALRENIRKQREKDKQAADPLGTTLKALGLQQ